MRSDDSSDFSYRPGFSSNSQRVPLTDVQKKFLLSGKVFFPPSEGLLKPPLSTFAPKLAQPGRPAPLNLKRLRQVGPEMAFGPRSPQTRQIFQLPLTTDPGSEMLQHETHQTHHDWRDSPSSYRSHSRNIRVRVPTLDDDQQQSDEDKANCNISLGSARGIPQGYPSL